MTISDVYKHLFHKLSCQLKILNTCIYHFRSEFAAGKNLIALLCRNSLKTDPSLPICLSWCPMVIMLILLRLTFSLLTSVQLLHVPFSWWPFCFYLLTPCPTCWSTPWPLLLRAPTWVPPIPCVSLTVPRRTSLTRLTCSSLYFINFSCRQITLAYPLVYTCRLDSAILKPVTSIFVNLSNLVSSLLACQAIISEPSRLSYA